MDLEPITRPYSQQDVDRELWDLLDLATDDELEAVHDILFGENNTQQVLLRC
jgi:hypothetical protein